MGRVLVFSLVSVVCACAAPPPQTLEPLSCAWDDVDLSVDLPADVDTALDADTAPPAGTVVAAQHVAHVDALSLSLSASTSVPFGAHVYRLLYVSWSDGVPSLQSARLAVPDSPEPARAVVGHQHGTFGLGDACAPSRLPGLGFESELNPNAAWALSQNFVVVMADYPGLGTPGRHPYVSRAATGHSVLDAVRAARAFCDDRRGVDAVGAVPTLLEGHSQGAHATVAALTVLDDDAANDDLDVRAAVALALPTDHAQLLRRMVEPGDVHPALIALGIAGQLVAHPEAFGTATDWFVDDVAAWIDDRGVDACAPELSLRLQGPPEALFRPRVLDAARDDDVSRLGVNAALQDEALDAVSPRVPLLVLHGDADALIPIDVVTDQATRFPPSAMLQVVPGADHWVLPSQQRTRTVDFLLRGLEAR